MIKCPNCGSDKVTKVGMTWRKRKKVQRYQCSKCGKLFTLLE